MSCLIFKNYLEKEAGEVRKKEFEKKKEGGSKVHLLGTTGLGQGIPVAAIVNGTSEHV